MAKEDKLITKDWIDRVSAALVDLGKTSPPRPRTFTRQKAIEEIAPIIRELQHKEFSLDDILPVLNIDGQKFTRAAVKTYMTRAPLPSQDQVDRPLKPSRRSGPMPGTKGKRSTDHSSSSLEPESDGSRLRAPVAEGTDTL